MKIYRTIARTILSTLGRTNRLTMKQKAMLLSCAIALAPASWGSKAEFIDWDRQGSKTCAMIYFTKTDIPALLCSDGTMRIVSDAP